MLQLTGLYAYVYLITSVRLPSVKKMYWQYYYYYYYYSGMLRPRSPCSLEAKSFSLGLTLSGLGLDLGLMASGLGLIEIGLVASNIYSAHDIN